MCGRFTLRTPSHRLAEAFGVRERLNLAPRYNIAPTQDAPVVRLAEDGRRELAMLRWGLVPSWADSPRTGYSMINARAETVARRPAFRAAFRRRRCLVPADGFYEWRTAGGRKQPYLIALKEADVFAFAGLWEYWRGPEDVEIESFTIIVTDANALVRPLHARMPVIVGAHDYERWLAGPQPEALLRPYPAEAMTAYAVNPRVNSPRHDDPACVAPAEAAG